MLNPKKSSRAIVLFVLILALCIVILTGCGSQPVSAPNPTNNSSASNTSQENSTIPAAEKTSLDGFPPPIPHTLEDKEQCMVCHRDGEVGKAPKTPHPELTNCRQCHVLAE